MPVLIVEPVAVRVRLEPDTVHGWTTAKPSIVELVKSKALVTAPVEEKLPIVTCFAPVLKVPAVKVSKALVATRASDSSQLPPVPLKVKLGITLALVVIVC